MSRIAYVNGSYVPHREAVVSIDDRGYQFADGIYEVVGIHNGRFFLLNEHLDRLDRSLEAVDIFPPTERQPLKFILEQVRVRNKVNNGFAYIQITRGVAPRAHAAPALDIMPSMVVTARSKVIDPKYYEKGVSIHLMEDLRWGRCDVKSISLLPNILAKTQAAVNGDYEAWLIDAARGVITEGSLSNAWIVDHKGVVMTHPADAHILPGITRDFVLSGLKILDIPVEVKAFTPLVLRNAREAFLTSTSGGVIPVVRVDGQAIGDGAPGVVTKRLIACCRDELGYASKS